MGFLRRVRLPDAIPSGFNGGRSQTNLGSLAGGEYPFLNVMKAAPQWSAGDFLRPITPDLVDADGYLTSTSFASTYGVRWLVPFPSQSERPGNYIITWDDTGTISAGAGGSQLGTATFTGSISGTVLTIPGSITGTIQFGQRVTGGTTLPYTFIMNQIDATHYTVSKSQTVAPTSLTADGGSNSSTSGSGSGFFACTIMTGVNFFTFSYNSIGSSSDYIKNVQIYHVDDAADIAAGLVFGKELKRRLVEANFGVIRLMDWLVNNTTNVTTWSTRKPVSYMFYGGYHLDNNLYAGATTKSGKVYSTSFPALHSSDGTAWTSGGPKDKDTVTVLYSSNSTATVTAAASSGASTVLTIATGALDATFNLVGEQVNIEGIFGSWSGLNGTRTVTAASAGSVTVSFDSSGLPAGGLAGTPVTIRHVTMNLSIGGSGAVNIIGAYCTPLSLYAVYYPKGGTFESLATLVYDATLNAWIQHGGCEDQGSVGIDSGIPIELCFQLCKEVGAHPYFCTPKLAIDPATDYMPNLVYYGKTYAAANATWMIPRYEGPNELWNTQRGFYQTGYANTKSAASWTSGNYMDWYGKALANLGQMCAQIYTGTNTPDFTKYRVLCGVQTHGGLGGSDERLASSKYIAQAAAADASLTGAWGTVTFDKTKAAKLTTSHIATAQYISGTERFSIDELIHAFAYSVTNKGSSAAQATIAANYCDTLTGSSSTPYTLGFCNTAYIAWKSWAATFGVNKMCGYEGAWSPDYLGTELMDGVAWWSFPTSRVQANPAILQLTSACTNKENSPGTIAGNPGVVGMAVAVLGSGTAFDNPGLDPVTISGSGFANIVGSNSLRLNQAVYLWTQGGGILPNETPASLTLTGQTTTRSECYYVVSAGTTFQLSATRGGSPIAFNSVGTGQIYAQQGWFITSVDAANNRVTLDCDSTGFATLSGGFLAYLNSQIYSNNLRFAGKLAPTLKTHTLTNYSNFVSAGGEFPSNYLIGGPSPSGNAWYVLEPLNQTPNSPQWEAFIAFNH